MSFSVSANVNTAPNPVTNTTTAAGESIDAWSADAIRSCAAIVGRGVVNINGLNLLHLVCGNRGFRDRDPHRVIAWLLHPDDPIFASLFPGASLPRWAGLPPLAVDALSGQPHGATALHCAVAAGYTAAVRALLAHGASKLVRDRSGKTPLDYARSAGNQEIINLLQ